MQYHFTTGALIGAVLVVMGSASPSSQNLTSMALSTPSFSPEYTNVAGIFTAIAGAVPISTLAPSSKYDIFSDFPINFGFGPVIVRSRHSDITLSTSASTVGTPTKTSIAASATASPEFPVFHPHFGHGPVIPGRGFHPKFNVTAHQTSSKASVAEISNSGRCETASVWFACKLRMRLERIFVFIEHNRHQYPERHPIQMTHEAHNKSLQGRSLDTINITYPESFGHNKPFQNQTTVEIHTKALQPPYLNETAPVSLSKTPYLNATTSADPVKTPPSTYIPVSTEMPSSTEVPSTKTLFPTPAETLMPSTTEYKEPMRPIPVNPIYFKISKFNLDRQILIIDQKIAYFEKQIDKAEKDVTHVHKLIGDDWNLTENDGTNLFLRAAQCHKSYAKEMLKKVKDEKKEVGEEREKLIRTSKF